MQHICIFIRFFHNFPIFKKKEIFCGVTLARSRHIESSNHLKTFWQLEIGLKQFLIEQKPTLSDQSCQWPPVSGDTSKSCGTPDFLQEFIKDRGVWCGRRCSYHANYQTDPNRLLLSTCCDSKAAVDRAMLGFIKTQQKTIYFPFGLTERPKLPSVS